MPPRSKLDQQPREIRERIANFLTNRDTPVTVDQFWSFLVDDLKLDLARSTAGNELKKWEDAAKRVRQTREVAEVIGRDLEDGKESKALRVLAEMVMSGAMEVFVNLEKDETLSAKDLAGFAMAVKNLGQGLAFDTSRELAIRKEVAAKAKEAAAKAASSAARQQGLTEDQAAFIRAQILGVEVEDA